ncbi:MAG: histidine--tRNA ligase [Nitrososphaerota archaeon]
MILDTPRGMDDLLPDEMALKRRIEDVIREVFALYGYLEVETPTVEYYELFAAKSGEEIRERMFDFVDKAGRRLVLRPEVTASIARLIATKLKAWPLPLRLGYIADCYRYDEPQWGRRRRFWQGGFELIGSDSPLADAEILQVSHDVFNRIGLREHFFKVGHVGILRKMLGSEGVNEDKQDVILSMIDRGMLEQAIGYAREVGATDEAAEAIKRLASLSGSGQEVFQQAEDILSPWDESRRCLERLREIVEVAEEGGVSSRIIICPGMARGLSYYDGFIFEQGVGDIQISLNGGGRYDKLIELFGGKPTPAVGCAIGITRIMQYIMDRGVEKPRPQRPKIFLAWVSGASSGYVMRVAHALRRIGYSVEVDVRGRKMPAAIEYALKNGMRYLVIIGEREEEEEKISIKDLERGIQQEVSLSDENRIREVLS